MLLIRELPVSVSAPWLRMPPPFAKSGALPPLRVTAFTVRSPASATSRIGYRQIVDNKFIQGLLNDFARWEGLDKEPECKEDTDMKLTAAYKQVGDWWAAWVEEIPGVNTQGKTLEEARENLKDALQMVLEANRELAEKEHEPTRREELVFA